MMAASMVLLMAASMDQSMVAEKVAWMAVKRVVLKDDLMAE